MELAQPTPGDGTAAPGVLLPHQELMAQPTAQPSEPATEPQGQPASDASYMDDSFEDAPNTGEEAIAADSPAAKSIEGLATKWKQGEDAVEAAAGEAAEHGSAVQADGDAAEQEKEPEEEDKQKKEQEEGQGELMAAAEEAEFNVTAGSRPATDTAEPAAPQPVSGESSSKATVDFLAITLVAATSAKLGVDSRTMAAQQNPLPSEDVAEAVEVLQPPADEGDTASAPAAAEGSAFDAGAEEDPFGIEAPQLPETAGDEGLEVEDDLPHTTQTSAAAVLADDSITRMADGKDAVSSAADDLSGGGAEEDEPAAGSKAVEEEPEFAAKAEGLQLQQTSTLGFPAAELIKGQEDFGTELAEMPQAAIEPGEVPVWEAGRETVATMGSDASAALDSDGPGNLPDGGAEHDAYSQAFQQEVSAKLMEVLSQEKLGEQETAADDAAAEGDELVAKLALPSEQMPAGHAGSYELFAPQDASVPLLKWGPPAGRMGGLPGKKGRGPAALASQPGITGGQSGPKSASHRMAPIGGRSGPKTHTTPAASPISRRPSIKMPPLSRGIAPAVASKTDGTATGPGRKVRSSSMEKQLKTAPPHSLGQAPAQLAGAGVAPGAFPALSSAPPDALLHWSRRPVATAAAQLPQHGILPAAQVPPGFLPGMVMLPGAGMMPAQADLAQVEANSDPGSALPAGSPDPAAAHTPAEGTIGEDGTGSLPAKDGSGSQQLDATTVLEFAYPYAPSPGQPATSLPQLMPAHQPVDVASSWPPYEGAKLPPLYQDQLSGAAGLIPAAYSFASSPNKPSGNQLAWSQAHQEQQGYYSGRMPQGHPLMMPQQWGGPAGSEQQRQAFYYQQQYQLYQQQYQLQLSQRQQQAKHDPHPDEPTFTREPMPQVPVALDPSGRPFKVFHGVAARNIRRPERYQSDGRPAWSVK